MYVNLYVYKEDRLKQQSCVNIYLSLFSAPGMVLVRSESGQLLMIPQQALAQMQAQAQAQAQSQAQGVLAAPRAATPTNLPPAQVRKQFVALATTLVAS